MSEDTDYVDGLLRPFFEACRAREIEIETQRVEIENLKAVDQIKTEDQQRLLNTLSELRTEVALVTNQRDYLQNVLSKFESAMIPLNAVMARRHYDRNIHSQEHSERVPRNEVRPRPEPDSNVRVEIYGQQR